jgi:hypothetical protein
VIGVSARRTRRVLAILALGAVLSGCGVTLQGEPRTVDRDEVPFELLEEFPTVTTTVLPATTGLSLPAGEAR